LRENLLNQRVDAMLYDEVYDASPNSLTTVTYVDGEQLDQQHEAARLAQP
jgi:hypothetical protein